MDKVSFFNEILSIMYAMGDCRRPLAESAKIVEEYLTFAMREYINEAQHAAEFRDEKWFSAEDLLFTLRKDRVLLFRIMNKLKVNDVKEVIKADEVDEDLEAADVEGVTRKTSKRQKLCESVLEKIDPTNESLSACEEQSVDDSVKRERQMRAAAYAASVDSGEFMRFTEARQVSFLSKAQAPRPRRFREWLFGVYSESVSESDANYFASFKPSAITLEVLNILAYETMATLMDCAFCVKRECVAEKSPVNDIVRLRPHPISGNVKLTNNAATSGDVLQPQLQLAPKFPRHSQQVAQLLAQQVRNRTQQTQLTTECRMEALAYVALQPWELREAIRRIRYYKNVARASFI